MAGNRAVTFMGPRKVEVKSYDYPKLVGPKGQKCEHGVIVKLVATNICGSDLHIYRGRFPAPSGTILGHENTGEVVEVGSHVEFIKKGDLVSVPFNVSCGKCRNCKEGHTDTCMNANDEMDCAAYGFNLGGWQGGQAEYMMVPWADFQLLAFPDKDQAMEKIRDLTLLSDILPTGFHGCYTAGVRPGSTVYIAGAGPVGRCAAASAHLLGASAIIVGDSNQERLALVKKAGYQTVDTSKLDPVADQIEAILGVREVDAGVDAVGWECHGQGPDAPEEPTAVLNTLFQVVRANGGMGIPGIYARGDPEARNEAEKQGKYALAIGQAWIKSPHLTAGQCPVMHYHRELMMAILQDRMPYLTPLLNTQFISLDEVPEAYRKFDAGAPVKYVIDPHGSIKTAA
ncbi:MAG: formaldehyde dehydrogenase, glutathione-independent [Devosia sp.]|uniref:glutathione-independent formaldehyde dehydrogenase n=1 Tax=Devosia sp. TaxID=1871048 RepID=UPI00260E7F91|nr:glutathione-independent formaldehyde dehydrogenase [Devosia sp.]MDB5539228.1 formaldehyde dehydrogenase, glutathione-independent [Devosia sp.]